MVDTLERVCREMGCPKAIRVDQGSEFQTGRPFQRADSGEYVARAYRQRFTLSSDRFAMIDDGLGFQLVPWTPSLEKHLGR